MGGNTAMGNGAGGNITTGYQNTNIGEGSGSITTGNDNTFIGYFAGYNVDTGYRNIAIGASSLSSQVVGYSKAGKDNIAIGYKANFGKGGDNNIVIGNKSLFDTSNLGSYNTIIGTNVSYPFANNNVIIADGQANIRFKDDNTNTILPRLAGTGTRMVTAGTNGELSTQTIPSGGTAYIDSIYRTAGKDSFFYKKNGNTYAIKDSVGTNPAPVGYYGAFSDTTSQTAVAINTGYAMKFALNDITPNGISMLVNGGGNKTRITFANTGVYNLQWSAQFTSIDNAENDVSVWLRKNGTDVVGSRGLVSVPKKLGLISGHALPSWNFVLSVVAGEYYEFVWSTSNTNVSIDALPLTAYAPSTASTILTVTQQSGIMAGTGITAINSLTAAAQTMVTGTDSSDFKIVSTGTSHTFNLPTASASKRGALSSTDWNTFNNKASGDTTSLYLISDATTSNLTATNTNLTFAIPANGTYRIMIAGTASKAVAATGLKLAIGAPTGCTIKAVQMSGGAVLSTAMTNSIITAVNTLGATFATGIATEVPFRIEGTIINGSTAGNIILQFASVVSNIATIYAGTVMQLTKSKGL